ncbi:MAG: hypothetical protein QM723_19765 [Myxococcaceae bacterium]
MFSLLVAVLASAAPDAIAVTPEPPAPPPRMNLYGAPLSTVVAAGLGLSSDTGGWYFPVGATARIGPGWGLSAELAGAMLPGINHDGWSLGASFGPTFFLSDDQGIEGFFITLKASAQYIDTPIHGIAARACIGGTSCLATGPGNSHAFMAGVDAGYTWRVHHFTIAAVLGAGLGYQENQGSSFTLAIDPISNTSSGLAWTLNLNFLRIGYAL